MTIISKPHLNTQNGPSPRRGFQRSRRKSQKGLLWTLAILGVALALGGGFWLWQGHVPDPVDTLNSQFMAAKAGSAPQTHVYGGAMRVNPSPFSIRADDLPPNACSKIGWYLAKTGMVIVNDVLAPRLSAAKLTELCHMNPTASLTWMPRLEEGK